MENQFFVIGHPLGHTMSPFIHERLFRLQNRQAAYQAHAIEPENFPQELPTLLKTASGLNITIPYKQTIIPYLTRLDGVAARYQSVNTVSCTADGAVGYNTDAAGFRKALGEAGIPLEGKVVILGCGGVARTFACESALAGCEVVLAVREKDLEKARRLGEFVEFVWSGAVVRYAEMDKLEGHIHLLVNATPVGMFPKVDACPVEARVLEQCDSVFDAVYNPHPTKLVRQAVNAGCRTGRGMAMLVWQAAAAHTIWYGAQFDSRDVAKLVDEATAFMQNAERKA